jgi:hypothetical protein
VRPRQDRHLYDGELELYERLTSGSAAVLRIEQERIPLTVAADHVARVLADRAPAGSASRISERPAVV